MKNVLLLFILLTGGTWAGAQPFELLLTQSPPGPQNTDPANWSGVLHFHLDGAGAALSAQTGIDKSAVADPAGLAFRPAASEVFVGNRHGNNQASSISRFKFNPVTSALTANGTITGNSLYGVHQLTFNRVSGEMFAANALNGVSRFTFDGSGNPVANGIIGSGTTRGVAVSPDGKRLYVTAASSVIRQFDLGTGLELSSLSVPSGNAGLHYFGERQGDLYVAALSAGVVYRYGLDANNDLQLKATITASSPVAMAFSPDASEMFVSGHRDTDVIDRFRYDTNTLSWTFTTQFNTGSSLGAVLVLPVQPQMAIRLSGPNTVVGWSLPENGWVLQRSSPISSNASAWLDIPGPYQTNFQENFTTFPSPGGNSFFRLRKGL